MSSQSQLRNRDPPKPRELAFLPGGSGLWGILTFILVRDVRIYPRPPTETVSIAKSSVEDSGLRVAAAMSTQVLV